MASAFACGPSKTSALLRRVAREEGRALVEAADEAMGAQGIVRLDRMTAMVAAGFEEG